MANRVGLLLSGCGALDGSDIHEAILAQLALDRSGAKVICAAPDMNHRHILNHITQEEMEAQRNVLQESARIARGNIAELSSLDYRQLDALIIPGGFGTVKNLCEFAYQGPTQAVDPQVRHLLGTMLTDKKPIGAIAMAAVMLVIALADHRPEVTVGKDAGIAGAIENMGGRHHVCQSNQIYVDHTHKIVTTPAYMLESGMNAVAVGIERLVERVLDLIGN